MRRTGLLALVALVAATVLALPSTAPAQQAPKGVAGTPLDTFHVGPDVSGLPLAATPAATTLAPLAAAAAAAPTVGEVRRWIGLDDVAGFFYSKDYTLRGIGEHIEVWVATGTRTFAGKTSTDTNFQDTDCRNGTRTQITDAQVNYLIGQFDGNIYPKESATFSVPPDRDGTNALLGPPFNPAGEGDDIVVLVDNVRDDNFYDLSNTQGFSYIAGFFSSQLNDLFDRNVMTIDAFDWLHRTGSNPPNEPVPGNNCTSAPARPNLYEGVFAHEYQHLLEHYSDIDEVNWINEGLSDWAQTLTGYVNPSISIQKTGFDSHTQCFLGWLGVSTPANPNPRNGGPENSLTRWGDQGDGEILCDYGAAYTMMEYLAGRYGKSFMTKLHLEPGNGLVGLQNVLKTVSRKTRAQDVLHKWALMAAVDGLLDKGARIDGRLRERDVSTPTLHATINWDTPDAYSTPGAPSNGADFVRLRKANGRYLTGGQIDSLSFVGAKTLPTQPVQWTVDANPPGQPGNPALYSGTADNRDEAIVRQVAVPSGAGAVLTFNGRWNMEETYDFAFVQISTDGGGTYISLPCPGTTDSNVAPDAISTVVDNLPGFTGDSGGFQPVTCSLADYAGQTVQLAFRTINDPSAQGTDPSIPAGFWVDDVMVGTTAVSDGSTLSGWKSFTETKANTVAGYTVYIVSMDLGWKDRITIKPLKLDQSFSTKRRSDADRYVSRRADFVAAIVFYDDPSETSTQYAPYRLKVNGVVQPGGGM